MIRRSGAAGIRRYAADAAEGEINPLEIVANLSDIMLVLAVALMIALVSHYNVNMAQTEVDEEDMVPLDQEEAESVANQTADGKSYEEVGVMYRDPDTGEVYVVSK